MEIDEGKAFVVRSRKQPYLVFAVIIAPIIILSLYAAIQSGAKSNLGAPAVMAVILGLIFIYLLSTKLILTKDHIMYQRMWGSSTVSVQNIQSVERARGPFGIGTVWIIRRNDGAAPLIVNVTNFDSHALREFGQALVAQGTNITFSAFRL